MSCIYCSLPIRLSTGSIWVHDDTNAISCVLTPIATPPAEKLRLPDQPIVAKVPVSRVWPVRSIHLTVTADTAEECREVAYQLAVDYFKGTSFSLEVAEQPVFAPAPPAFAVTAGVAEDGLAPDDGIDVTITYLATEI